MPTLNPRITFTLSEEMANRIDEFRFDNRIKNQTQAIVALLNIGLKSLGDEPLPPEFTEEEVHLVEVYRGADPIYQKVSTELLETHQIKKAATGTSRKSS